MEVAIAETFRPAKVVVPALLTENGLKEVVVANVAGDPVAR